MAENAQRHLSALPIRFGRVGSGLAFFRVPGALIGFQAGQTAMIHSIVFLAYMGSAEARSVPPYFRASVLVLIGMSFFISGMTLLTPRSTPNAMLAIIRGFLFFLLVYMLHENGILEVLLGIDCLTPLVIRMRRRLFPYAAGAFILFTAAFQYPNRLLGKTAPGYALPRPGIRQVVPPSSALMIFALLSYVLRNTMERMISLERNETNNREVVARLIELNARFQDFAYVAEQEGSARERTRITRDIHDITGHIFTSLISLMDVAIGIGQSDADRLTELHMLARKLAGEGLQQTSSILQLIQRREGERQRGDYRHLVRIFETVSHINIRVESTNTNHSYGEPTDEVIFSLIREALTNVLRHSNADDVQVHLWESEDTLLVYVTDNGTPITNVQRGLGLGGVETRLREIGGSLEVNCSKAGFQVSGRIPLGKEG